MPPAPDDPSPQPPQSPSPPGKYPSSHLRRFFWRAAHILCYYWFTLCYSYRAWGVANIPAAGPVIYLSNHQSYLDPILVGLALHKRRFFSMARSSLFHNPLLGWLIRLLNAIPIDRGSADLAAMRTCIDVLRNGDALLVFPEGTRTLDGATRTLNPGTMLLIKRGNAKIVPVALEGPFAAWPKKRRLPNPFGRLGVMYGKPIDPQTLIRMGPDAAMRHLQNTIESMRLQVHHKLSL